MDEFDLLNQSSEPSQNTNNQADDLFGSGNTAPIDTSSNEQQLDPTWATDNVKRKKRLFVIHKCLILNFYLGFK
jgi:hypothetical protein